jgi:hypothetical protein
LSKNKIGKKKKYYFFNDKIMDNSGIGITREREREREREILKYTYTPRAKNSPKQD